MLAIAGRPPQWPKNNSPELTEGFRAGPIEAHRTNARMPSQDWEDLRTRSRPLPSGGVASDIHHPPPQINDSPVDSIRIADTARASGEASPVSNDEAAIRNIERWVAGELSALCGYPARFCEGQVDLRGGLGMSDAQISTLIAGISRKASTDPEVDITSAATAADITRWVTTAPSAATITPAVVSPDGKTVPQEIADATISRRNNPYVVTGISLGLPGGERVFDEDNFEKLVRGDRGLMYTIGVGKSFTDYENVLKDVLKIIEAD